MRKYTDNMHSSQKTFMTMEKISQGEEIKLNIKLKYVQKLKQISPKDHVTHKI
jgi:hypothetical protein